MSPAPADPMFQGAIQTAFVVEDIRGAMARYTRTLNAGPWFLRERHRPPGATYRGRPTDVELSLAFGYAGNMMFELIEQHDDGPSAFRDVVEKRGYGLHHIGVVTRDFDASRDKYLKLGYEIAFSAQRFGRVAIFDTLADCPAMMELLEMVPESESFFRKMHQASLQWDGSDPVRVL